ncbi:MAG: hypothetical protein PHD02_03095 [Bacilli bacterium]|nr:hypothetical protein [Bacilli bacterium]
MAYTFFSGYEKYFTNLGNNTNMTSSSSALANVCANDFFAIKSTYFNRISESKWKELASPIVKTNIIVSLSKSIEKLDKLISEGLVVATDIAINSLLPKVINIKEEDEHLQRLKHSLSNAESTLNSLYASRSSINHYKIDSEGNKIINKEYTRLTTSINREITIVNGIRVNINTVIKNLIQFCSEANTLITQIGALDGSEISLPDISGYSDLSEYGSIPFEPNENDLTYLDGLYDESVIFEKVGCRIYVPSGTTITDTTKLTVYLTGSGGRGQYFKALNEGTYNDITTPTGPVLVIVSDSFYKSYSSSQSTKNGETIDTIIQDAKSYLGITTPKVSIITYSLGNNLFSWYAEEHSSSIDSAVLINPCSVALKNLTQIDTASSISSAGKIQIIQADNETKDHISAHSYELAQKFSQNNDNVTISYYKGNHGDEETVITGEYKGTPEEVSRALTEHTIEGNEITLNDYVSPTFNVWDYIN